MKIAAWIILLLVIVVVGIGSFFTYRESRVSTDFKEKARVAIDALDTATTKVCDDDISYIPASVAAKFAVEEACAESHAATTASLRSSLSWRVANLDAVHHLCMLKKGNQRLEREIRANGGKATPSPVPDYKQIEREKIVDLRKKLQDLQ